MALFNADSYQEVSIDWLTVTLKYDNHGGGQAMLLTQGPWDEVRDRLIAYIEHKLDLTRPDEITEKNTNKGYNRTLKYSNGLELQFHDLYSYMGILVDMSGDTLRRFRAKGWTDRQVVNALDWNTDDVFNDATTQAVNWHRHMTRVDLAIDYYNTNLKVEPLANKVTRTKEIEVWYQQYNRRTHGYDEQRSRAEAYAHMNNGQFETLYIGRPGGSYQIRVYNKLLEQQTNSANPIPAGVKSWVRSELVLRQDLPESFVRSVQQVEDDDAFCRLIYRFTVNKMILKYQSGRKHELTNDMMKRAKGEGIVRYSKSKPDDFLRAKYEHMMGGSGLIGFLQILKGLEAEGHPGLREQFWELARAASDTRDMPKDIATQMAGIVALASSEDYRLPFGNR